ncbi:MAG: monovalent cation/H(+) antiporter subunit G [Gammaproteobacteria bacterium]|nr:monovalent cation/H(+) antiporter subunit G [Gammaproteobacteria bacterium]
MSMVLGALSWVFLLAGGFFVIVGGVGLLRMPDLFTRMHAAGIADTMGTGLILVGLTFQSDDWVVTAKLLLILYFIIFANPTSTHAVARSALDNDIRPLLPEEQTDHRAAS